MPGEITLHARLNRTIFQTQPTTQKVYLLLEVTPTAAAAGHAPLNAGFVLDRSGSMAGEKIQHVRDAVTLILRRMQPQDRVALVLFDDKVDLLAPNQPLADSTVLQAQVGAIVERGGTTMAKGMRKGLEELRRGLAPTRVSRMILLTDGETYGDEQECRELARECGQAGIPISAFGLGDEWNADLLDAIARNSGGQSDHLAAPEQIIAEFQHTLQAMQGTVATNASLTLRLVSGVAPAAAWRIVPQISKLDARAISDRDVQLYLGDLEAGAGQSILIELVVQPKPEGAYRIAQAEVNYDLPGAGLRGERMRVDIMLALAEHPARVSPPDPELMNLIEKISVFKLQTRALTEAQAGNLGLATQQLRTAATRLLSLGETELAEAAAQEIANLEQHGQLSAAGAKKLQYGTRKLTQRLDEPA
jgi:Ca-activated chloride channel homolog